jgi:hypothetical protein
MSLINDCLGDLGTYVSDLCGNDLIPGISAFAIIDQDNTFTDFTSVSEWNTNISAGAAIIIRDGKGTYPDAAPILVDNSRANGPDQVLRGMNHTFTFMDPNVSGTNDTFWSIVNGRNILFAWYNFEEEQLMVVSDYNCHVVALPANDDAGTSVQRYNVTITWKTKPDGFPSRVTAPAGIFA